MDEPSFALGEIVLTHGLSESARNGQTGWVHFWHGASGRYAVSLDGSKEMVRIKPRNLLKRPAAVRPKAPHRWTGASLDLCYEFLLCARHSLLGWAPLALICEFLRVPCRGLAPMGHECSPKGGHPLASLVRLWHAMGAEKAIQEMDSEVARELLKVFHDLDIFDERHVVSLEGLLRELRATGAVQNVEEGAYADFACLQLEMCLVLGERAQEHQVLSAHSVICTWTSSCCGWSRQEPLLLTLPAEERPLELQIQEAMQSGGFENYHCHFCGQTATLLHQLKLADCQQLCVEIRRFAFVAGALQMVRSPIGAFPQRLALPPELFATARAAVFELKALALHNEDPDLAAVGYSSIVRAGGLWWWHRSTAVGRPVTGHTLGSRWGGATLAAPKQVTWEEIQQLRHIVYYLVYTRV
ncbi:unnamed protein product [Effrenium voratum]|nr:unnamed protein product [Effrenium voratum]